LPAGCCCTQELTTLPGFGWLARLKEARKEGRSGEAHTNWTINWMALGFAVYLVRVRVLPQGQGSGGLPCMPAWGCARLLPGRPAVSGLCRRQHAR
jgi:hypothetical protein